MRGGEAGPSEMNGTLLGGVGPLPLLRREGAAIEVEPRSVSGAPFLGYSMGMSTIVVSPSATSTSYWMAFRRFSLSSFAPKFITRRT